MEAGPFRISRGSSTVRRKVTGHPNCPGRAVIPFSCRIRAWGPPGDHTPCAWSNFARVPTGRRTMWSAY